MRTNAAPGTLLGLRVYAWGGRLSGWRRIRTGVSSTSPDLTWNGTTATGAEVGDGTYQVTVCYKDQGRPLAPRGVVRPGLAEASVRRPPWRTSGCAPAHVVRVERLAAFVDSTGSFHQGDRVPLVVSADEGQVARPRAGLHGQPVAPDVQRHRRQAARRPVRRRRRASTTPSPPIRPATASEAPVVVRSGRPLDRPKPHTALVVWPYLTWRAYSAYDADLNGIPDSWYQFWRQRRVSLKGPLLRDGVEDDHKAALPFSRWLCSRSPSHAADHRRRARPPAALDAAQVQGDRLPRPQRVLRAGHVRPAEALPRRRRQPRLPAGEPVLPPGAARPRPERDGA